GTGGRQRRIARGREDRDQRARPGRMVERHELGDHAAHRGAGDMRAGDTELVEQRRGVGCHVVEGVGHVRLAAGAGRRRHGADIGENTVPFLGEADVAVVEADDAQAVGLQAEAKLVRPGGHLAAEAVDEEKRDAVRRTGHFVFDLDAVGANPRHEFLPISGQLSGDALLDKGRVGPEGRAMRRALDRLASETFDLLIVGGGVTGACVARDAAMRGLKVALVEKADFAGATSAHNSKLVHGGLRYLRNFELGLVRESLKERRIWQRIAPHLVHPLPFLVPLYGGEWKARATLAAGLSLYDVLSFDKGWLDDPAQRLPNHRWLDARAALAEEPVLEGPGLVGAFRYFDAQMYAPERLALECLIEADGDGAAIANYVAAEKIVTRNGRVEGCSVRDVFSGASFDVRATATLVAAGPWADIFLEQALGKPASHKLLRSKGIHVLVPAMTRSNALTVAAGGGHFFVLPWHGHTLLGTTDTAFQSEPDAVAVSE